MVEVGSTTTGTDVDDNDVGAAFIGVETATDEQDTIQTESKNSRTIAIRFMSISSMIPSPHWFVMPVSIARRAGTLLVTNIRDRLVVCGSGTMTSQ
jgi:hypothetical protein